MNYPWRFMAHHSRFGWCALLLLGFAKLTGEDVSLPLHAAESAARPNILILLSDDHSYPYLSCYGSPNVKTPTIDRLAAEGMRFHRYFTAAPQCVPARAALMTGRSPVAARMTRFSSPLPRDEITLPELLRSQAGYYTGICGRSYHLDGSGTRGGEEIGQLLEKHRLKTFADRVDFLTGGSDNKVPEQVAEFLEKRPAGKPFFLWANFSDPHHVWNAPADLRPDPQSLTLPAHWPDLPGVRAQVADYCAEINRLDQTIAQVLAELQQRQLLDSTLIVFAGDNGVALPHGKGSLYDPGSNVPLVIRGPGVKATGAESHTLLSGEDIAPTLLAAAGLLPGAKMSGQSFWPLLTGGDYAPRQHVFVERGPHGSGPVTAEIVNSTYDLSRAVRSERYKLIYNCTPWIPYSPVDSSGGPAWTEIKAAHAAGELARGVSMTYFSVPRPVYELYDLQTDPSELNNLSGKSEWAAIERDLRLALAEKMIVDFDYLPLPDLRIGRPAAAEKGPTGAGSTGAGSTGAGATGAGATGAGSAAPGVVTPTDRTKAFARLDRDQDGRLTKAEFTGSRAAAEAEKWFTLRDTNRDGVLSLEEYRPEAPPPKPQ